MDQIEKEDALTQYGMRLYECSLRAGPGNESFRVQAEVYVRVADCALYSISLYFSGGNVHVVFPVDITLNLDYLETAIVRVRAYQKHIYEACLNRLQQGLRPVSVNTTTVRD